LRIAQTALLACLTSSCSALANSAGAPVGLTCTDRHGAVVRLNLDIAAGEFQKDGFPKMAIVNADARTIVLLRHAGPSTVITAWLDRRSMTYSAQAEDRTTGGQTRTDYRCRRGPAFATGT